MKAILGIAFGFCISLLVIYLVDTLKMAIFEFKTRRDMSDLRGTKRNLHQEFLQLLQLMLDETVDRVAVSDAWLDKSMVRVSNRHAPNLFLDKGCGIKEIVLTFSDILTSNESLDIIYAYDTDYSPPIVLSALVRHSSGGRPIPAPGSTPHARGWYRQPDSQKTASWLYLQIYEYLIRVEESNKRELEKRERLRQMENNNRLTQAEVGSLLKSIGIQMRPEGDQ